MTNIFTTFRCKLMYVCFALAILPATMKRDDESDTDEYGDDSEDFQFQKYVIETTHIDLTGNLRRTLVYHMAMMDTRKSAVCSPISALLPLGKLAMGSSKRNYKELNDAIGYRHRKVVPQFKQLMQQLGKISGKVQLVIASRLYVSIKEELSRKFSDKVERVFKSSCELVDFKRKERTAEMINSWVSRETKGLIQNIIKPGEISASTSLIITNAVYFLGIWRYKFKQVKKEVFRGPSKETHVQMMYEKNFYKYTESSTLNAQIVEIPYESKEASFIAVLPKQHNGLAALMRKLIGNPNALNDAFESMRMANLKLYIPKFKITSNLDLNSLYYKVGLRQIFEPNNTVLTHVIKRKSVHVSRSVQMTVLEVNEHGTEGAAVTILEIESLSSRKLPVFKANHSFLFFVVANNEQLFSGVFTNE